MGRGQNNSRAAGSAPRRQGAMPQAVLQGRANTETQMSEVIGETRDKLTSGQDPFVAVQEGSAEMLRLVTEQMRSERDNYPALAAREEQEGSERKRLIAELRGAFPQT
jgi:hypothetical protein